VEISRTIFSLCWEILLYDADIQMIFSNNAIEYTIRCIADIAFPQKECRIELGDVPTLVVDPEIEIKFIRPDDSNVELLDNGNLCYSNVKSFDNKVSLKVFFLRENDQPFSFDGKCVYVNFDMLGISFLLLSRYEETLTEHRDKFGRFCYEDSLCCKYEIADIPIVDEYAMLLRKFVQECFPNFVVISREPNFIPTHDIDFLFRFPNFRKAVKTIAGDLFKRKSLRMSCKSLVAYMKSLRDFRRDPYVSAVYELLKVSVENRLYSLFYFKSLQNRDLDSTYNILSPKSHEYIKDLQLQGASVGLHGSLYSFADKVIFTIEKSRFEGVSGCEVAAVRQHFLRFNVRKTPQIWQECGIRSDSTLGFPEREGFRCGTCHPYPLYDIVNDRVLDVVEHPLVVMDTTLFQYRKLSENEAFDIVRKLYDRCVAVEGDFVMLWHNTTMFGELESWYKNVYLRFLDTLK